MHKLLQRQLDKSRKTDGTIDIDQFVELVRAAYEEAELDRVRTDRSISMMVGELDSFEAGLEDKIALRTAQLRESKKSLKIQNTRFTAALENMSHALSMYDKDQRLVTCNQQFLEIYGLPKRFGKVGTTFRSILEARVLANTHTGTDPIAYVDERIAVAARGEAASAVLRLNSGKVLAVTHQPLKDGGWVSTHKDVTELTHLQDELAHLAYHDALTSLPNRHMLHRQIAENLKLADGAGSFAVLFLDLDGFKAINDTMGHGNGDKILQQVASRLSRVSGTRGLAGRLGGDEFAVVMQPGAAARDAHLLALDLVAAAREPFLADGQTSVLRFSIGIAVAPSDGTSADELLKNADLALYAAKESHRGSFRFYEPAMGRALTERLEIEHDLAAALAAGDFELFYQPILNLKTQAFAGFEALLRWRHNGEMVSPARFVPIAEETGLIVPLGEWVLRQALAEAARWPDNLRVAINVSSVQFQRGNIVAVVMNALGATGIAPGRVEIEITESVFFENSAANLEALRQLHALGVKIALDDFGTGFSALGYLISYPFDKIKIDGSFVRALDNATGAHAIVRAVSEIGYRMGISTTAEGVETAAQLRNVYAAGYTEAQGYLIARPMPVSALHRMLKGEDDQMPEMPFAQRAAG